MADAYTGYMGTAISPLSAVSSNRPGALNELKVGQVYTDLEHFAHAHKEKIRVVVCWIDDTTELVSVYETKTICPNRIPLESMTDPQLYCLDDTESAHNRLEILQAFCAVECERLESLNSYGRAEVAQHVLDYAVVAGLKLRELVITHDRSAVDTMKTYKCLELISDIEQTFFELSLDLELLLDEVETVPDAESEKEGEEITEQPVDEVETVPEVESEEMTEQLQRFRELSSGGTPSVYYSTNAPHRLRWPFGVLAREHILRERVPDDNVNLGLYLR